MKNSFIFLIMISALFSLNAKKGIIVASFGTSYQETRVKTIEACEKKIAQAFPEYEVRRVFTSNMVRKIIKKKENIEIDSLDQALQKMKNEGFSEIIIQPLHILNGEEYHVKILQPAAQYKQDFQSLSIGRPILSSIHDYDRVINAITAQLPKQKKKTAVLFMGHGTHHPANSAYSCLQLKYNQSFTNVYIGTVEGYPLLDDIIGQLKKAKIKEVYLYPFMVVAGDHASNDMAGDEEDSWKSILQAKGFQVKTVLQGLGENPLIQDMYVENIQDCINGHPQGNHE
ncbi:MAG: sirohydrochlorin cobaltochelatase [Spirochaetes bacterium]|nr:sirohydrochlorin cobaltochelatase [Spirochaetota bacterium]